MSVSLKHCATRRLADQCGNDAVQVTCPVDAVTLANDLTQLLGNLVDGCLAELQPVLLGVIRRRQLHTHTHTVDIGLRLAPLTTDFLFSNRISQAHSTYGYMH